MSAYCIVETDFNDADSIKAALEEMGYVYEEHKIAQQLDGYLGDKRAQKAHIIIRRQHVGASANDVGFHQRADGTFELIISTFDRSGNKKQAVDFTKNIKKIYSKHRVLKECKRRGFQIKSKKDTTENKLKIKVRV